MRIYDEDRDRTLGRVTLLLREAEARELLDGLRWLLEKKDGHVHVNVAKKWTPKNSLEKVVLILIIVAMLGISTSLFENVRTIGWLTEIVWTDKLKITEDRRYEGQVTRNDSSSPWTTAGAGSIRSR